MISVHVRNYPYPEAYFPDTGKRFRLPYLNRKYEPFAIV